MNEAGKRGRHVARVAQDIRPPSKLLAQHPGRALESGGDEVPASREVVRRRPQRDPGALGYQPMRRTFDAYLGDHHFSGGQDLLASTLRIPRALRTASHQCPPSRFSTTAPETTSCTPRTFTAVISLPENATAIATVPMPDHNA